MNFIVFLMICFGITNSVTGGKLFEPLRRFQVFRCPMCFGFWVGILVSAVGSYNIPHVQVPDIEFIKSHDDFYITAINLVACGFISSGWCWILRVILHKLGEDHIGEH
jgi:hypothetical protein